MAAKMITTPKRGENVCNDALEDRRDEEKGRAMLWLMMLVVVMV